MLPRLEDLRSFANDNESQVYPGDLKLLPDKASTFTRVKQAPSQFGFRLA